MNNFTETRHWAYTAKTLESVVASADLKSIPDYKNRISRLREIQSAYRHAESERNKHSVDKAIAEGRAQHVKLQKVVSEGQTIAPVDVFTQDEMKEEAARKRHAAKAVQKAATAEAVILARPILERVAEAANDQAVDVERAEKEQHRAFDVPHTRSSDLVLTLRHIAATIVGVRLDGAVVSAPAEMLKGIVTI